MKKQMYGIIGLCGAVAVLGGGLAVLKMTDKPSGDSSSTPSAVTTQAYGAGLVIFDDCDTPYTPESEDAEAKGKVKSVKVTSSKTELDAVIAKPATDSESAVYTLKGYEDLDVDSLLVSTLFNNLAGITSLSIVEENCTDFDKFGLADSAITAEVTFESGNVKKFYIGDNSPVSSDSYVRVEGSNTVYTVTNARTANFREAPSHFVSKTVLESLPSDGSVRIETLDIEREDLVDGFAMEYNKEYDIKTGAGSSAIYVLSKPIRSYFKTEEVETVVQPFYGLFASDIKVLHCEEKDIAECGLDKPYCKVTAVCNDGRTDTVLFGEPFKNDEGEEICYGMAEGGKVIYIFKAERIKWLKLVPADVLSQNILVSFVWNLDKLELKSDSKTLSFEIEPIDSETDRTTARKELMSVKLNGSGYDSERYRQLYAFIVSMPAEQMAYNEPVPSSAPMASLKYNDVILNKSETYEFYDYSAMKCLIVVDGKSKYICTKSYVTTLIDNIRRAESGEQYVTSWKN